MRARARVYLPGFRGEKKTGTYRRPSKYNNNNNKKDDGGAQRTRTQCVRLGGKDVVVMVCSAGCSRRSKCAAPGLSSIYGREKPHETRRFLINFGSSKELRIGSTNNVCFFFLLSVTCKRIFARRMSGLGGKFGKSFLEFLCSFRNK